jgi:F-type H+-transporting ATPase subunit delta
MKHLKVAGRYAKALLDLAVERNLLERVYADVQLVRNTLRASSELRAVLHSPVINHDKKEAILDAVFQNNIDELTRHFCVLVARHGREAHLSEILNRFMILYRQHRNIVVAQITTAAELDQETLTNISGLMKIEAGREVEMRTLINPDIIGGFILRVGDLQTDASVSGKLRDMRRAFKENPYLPEF